MSLKYTDVTEVRTASIALMMEELRTSETLIYFNETILRHIP
jgi:hypothetical protein